MSTLRNLRALHATADLLLFQAEDERSAIRYWAVARFETPSCESEHVYNDMLLYGLWSCLRQQGKTLGDFDSFCLYAEILEGSPKGIPGDGQGLAQGAG